MKLHRTIEIVNDTTLAGIGILSFDSTWSVRSLFAVFWNKEEHELWIDILFINFKIKAK